jgi:hypothetical protein
MRSKRSCDLAYLKTGAALGGVVVSGALGAEEKALVAVGRGRSPVDAAARRMTVCEEEYIVQERLIYCSNE